MSDPSPLTEAQKEALKEARARLGAVRKAAAVSAVTAWTVGVFGVLSVLWGLLAGLTSTVLGAALLAIAWNEARGRTRLRALDPEGAWILGWNQIVLGVLVAAYGLWVIVMARVAPAPSVQEMQELVGVDGDLIADLTALVYGAVIVIVAAVQYGLARFHFRRRELLESFRDDTPDWVVELLSDALG